MYAIVEGVVNVRFGAKKHACRVEVPLKSVNGKNNALTIRQYADLMQKTRLYPIVNSARRFHSM